MEHLGKRSFSGQPSQSVIFSQPWPSTAMGDTWPGHSFSCFQQGTQDLLNPKMGNVWLGTLLYTTDTCFWVNFITTSRRDRALGIMVNKGNHPQMAARFRLVKYYNLPRCLFLRLWILKVFIVIPYHIITVGKELHNSGFVSREHIYGNLEWWCSVVSSISLLFVFIHHESLSVRKLVAPITNQYIVVYVRLGQVQTPTFPLFTIHSHYSFPLLCPPTEMPCRAPVTKGPLSSRPKAMSGQQGCSASSWTSTRDFFPVTEMIRTKWLDQPSILEEKGSEQFHPESRRLWPIWKPKEISSIVYKTGLIIYWFFVSVGWRRTNSSSFQPGLTKQ